MKKKGLIVATIVMVLVLAVSLTTATYAWFTADTKTTVDDISFGVGAGSDVLIGVKIDGKYETDPIVDDFVNDGGGDVTYNGSVWDGQLGLGATINTGLNFSNMTAAIGTGTVDTDGVDPLNSAADDSWVFGNTVIKANGMGYDKGSVDKASIKAAQKNSITVDDVTTNGDYLDIVLGIQASKDNLTKIVCNIVINPQGTTTTLGMAAALRTRYCLDKDDTQSANWVEVDLYGTTNKYSTKKTAITTDDTARQVATQAIAAGNNAFGVSGLAVNAGAVCYSIVIDEVDEGALSVDTIYQLHLIIYLAGYDTDCINAAMGTASTIGIHFTTEAPAQNN